MSRISRQRQRQANQYCDSRKSSKSIRVRFLVDWHYGRGPILTHMRGVEITFHLPQMMVNSVIFQPEQDSIRVSDKIITTRGYPVGIERTIENKVCIKKGEIFQPREVTDLFDKNFERFKEFRIPNPCFGKNYLLLILVLVVLRGYSSPYVPFPHDGK